MNRKRLLIALLIVLSLAIWSHNAYRIIVGVGQCDDESIEGIVDFLPTSGDSLNPLSTENKPYVYQAKYRDPFRDWLRNYANPSKSKAKGKGSDSKTKKAIVKIPSLRFCGVVQDGSGVLAIVEDPNGNVVFIRERDKIADVEIRRIARDALECQFKDQWFRLTLDES